MQGGYEQSNVLDSVCYQRLGDGVRGTAHFTRRKRARRNPRDANERGELLLVRADADAQRIQRILHLRPRAPSASCKSSKISIPRSTLAASSRTRLINPAIITATPAPSA